MTTCEAQHHTTATIHEPDAPLLPVTDNQHGVTGIEQVKLPAATYRFAATVVVDDFHGKSGNSPNNTHSTGQLTSGSHTFLVSSLHK